jgi:hypothetical protein
LKKFHLCEENGFEKILFYCLPPMKGTIF